MFKVVKFSNRSANVKYVSPQDFNCHITSKITGDNSSDGWMMRRLSYSLGDGYTVCSAIYPESDSLRELLTAKSFFMEGLELTVFQQLFDGGEGFRIFCNNRPFERMSYSSSEVVSISIDYSPSSEFLDSLMKIITYARQLKKTISITVNHPK